MNEKTLEKLNKLMEISQQDTVTPKEIDQFITAVLQFVTKEKNEMKSMTEEQKKFIQDAVIHIQSVYENNLAEIKAKGQETTKNFSSEISKIKSIFTDKMKEAQKIIKELQAIELKDGEDGKDADEEKIVEEVLSKIKIPEVIPDTGYEIIEKINDLPINNDEYKIGWKHLKDVPDFSNIRNPNGGGWRNLFQLHDVNTSGVTDGQALVYQASTQTWVPGTGGSGGTQTLAQTLVLGNVTGGTNIALSYNTAGGVTDKITSNIANNYGNFPSISFQGGGLTAAGIYIDPVGTTNPNVSSAYYSFFSSADGFFHTTHAQAVQIDASQAITIGGALTYDGRIELSNATTANSLVLKAGATASAITYILPAADPTAGQALVATAPVAGVSTLSWGSPAAGAPTLTSTQVAYGSGVNVMTSSSNLVFDNANTQLSIAGNGTGALPAYAVGGTTNGMLLSAADQLGFSTAGVTRMTVDSVSTSSVTNGGYWLARAAGAVGAPTYSFKNDTDTGFYSDVANTVKATFGGTQYSTWNSTGLFLGGTTTPTARLHLAAGTTSASTAPLKFTTGTSMTAAEAGAMEYTTDDLFFTISTGTARKRLLMADPVGGLTSTRVPFATTNGRLTDSANMSFTTDTLFVEKIKVGTGNNTIEALNQSSYTPTYTSIANLDSITGTDAYYVRVGRNVHVWGQFTTDPTTAGSVCQFTISLPIASDLAAIQDVIGHATNSADGETAGRIYADTAGDTAVVEFTPKGITTSYDWSWSFDYVII